MNGDLELDPSVLAWFEDGPSFAPDGVVTSAFAVAAALPQSRDRRFMPRIDPMSLPMIWLGAGTRRVTVLLAILIVLAIAAVAAFSVASRPPRPPGISNGAVVFAGGPADAVFVVDGLGVAPRAIARTFLSDPSAPPASALMPTISPTGRDVAFMYWSGNGSGQFGVAIAGLDGTLRRSVGLPNVRTVDASLWTPISWSPDAARIALSDWQPASSVVLMDVASGAMTRLPLAGRMAADSPAWSPDGSHLVVRGYEGQTASLWVIDPATAGARRVDGDDGDYYHLDFAAPQWSPDGDSLVYQDGGFGGEHDLYVLSPRSGTRVDITNDTEEEHWPSWSPDGRHLAWERGDMNGRNDVVVANSDGSGARIITVDLSDGVGSGPQLAWSPDGSSIIAAHCPGSVCEQFVILDAFGSAPARFLEVPGGIPSRSVASWGRQP